MGLLSANEMFRRWLDQNKPNPSVAMQTDPMVAAGADAAEKLGLTVAGLFGIDTRPEDVKRRAITEKNLQGLDLTNPESLKKAMEMAVINKDYGMANDLFNKYIELKNLNLQQQRASIPRTGPRPRYRQDVVSTIDGVPVTRITNLDNPADIKYITPNGEVFTRKQAVDVLGPLVPVNKNQPEASNLKELRTSLQAYLSDTAGYGFIADKVAKQFSKDIGNMLRNNRAIRETLGQQELFDILAEVMEEKLGGGITLGGLLPKEWKLDKEEASSIGREFRKRVKEKLRETLGVKKKVPTKKKKKQKKKHKMKSAFFEQVDEPAGGVQTLTAEDLMRFAQ